MLIKKAQVEEPKNRPANNKQPSCGLSMVEAIAGGIAGFISAFALAITTDNLGITQLGKSMLGPIFIFAGGLVGVVLGPLAGSKFGGGDGKKLVVAGLSGALIVPILFIILWVSYS